MMVLRLLILWVKLLKVKFLCYPTLCWVWPPEKIDREFNSLSCEKVKLEEEGYDYFDNLPDELLMLIFSKLGTATGENTLNDVKSLGRCSTLCKRFNSLTGLIHTLSISHPSINVLHECCPKILKKFNHIRSLRVEYKSDSKAIMSDSNNSIPLIYSKATYDPHHNYSLAVITCTDLVVYAGQYEHYPQPSFGILGSPHKYDLVHTTRCYTSFLFHLHHMLFLSIRDHKLIQKVVVTDFQQRESFTLVEEQLIELRNDIITTNLAQVQGCHRGGFYDTMNLPLSENHGLYLKNVTFCLFIRSGNSTRIDEDNIPQLDGSGKVLQKALELLVRFARENLYCYENIPKILFEGEWF